MGDLLFDTFLVLLLVFANGFFVAVEFAVVRSRSTKLRSPELESKYGTKSSLSLMKDLDGSLSATQLGITFASLILGWWGEQTFHSLIFRFFEFLGPKAALVASHAMATVLAILVITFLHVVIGELAAKTLAIRHPETTLRFLAPIMVFFAKIFKPLVWLLNKCARLFLKLFGVNAVVDSERVHTAAELEMLIQQSTERGILDKEEEEMLQGVFGFADTVAREVMTPRTELITISIDSDFNSVITTILESGHSRFPVIGESVDDIKGVLLARDLLQYMPKFLKSGTGGFSVKGIMRKPYFVPESKPIDDLLEEFKLRNIHMAIVVDEHGGVDGLVTLEDLIEEIVGEIFDESDTPEEDCITSENGDIVVDGRVLVSEVNDRFSMAVPEGDYDTIAGFVFTALGRIPEFGDEIELRKNGGAVFAHVDKDEDEIEGIAQPITYENGKNGAETSADGSTTLLATVKVERVNGYRIEKVRLIPHVERQVLESVRSEAASKANEKDQEKVG